MEQNKSQVLFKAGDRVLTSKGKIGVITKDQQIFAGYYNDSQFVIEDKFNSQEELEIVKLQYRAYIIAPPQVRIGHKEFVIKEEHLTKLEDSYPVNVIYTNDGQEANTQVVFLPKGLSLVKVKETQEFILNFLEALTGKSGIWIVDIETI